MHLAFSYDEEIGCLGAPDLIAEIAARTRGRQLNTTMGDVNGRAAYFVQWQTPDNRVIIFVVDAQSGQIIGRQGG